jgi:hypothetical protein
VLRPVVHLEFVSVFNLWARTKRLAYTFYNLIDYQFMSELYYLLCRFNDSNQIKSALIISTHFLTD